MDEPGQDDPRCACCVYWVHGACFLRLEPDTCDHHEPIKEESGRRRRPRGGRGGPRSGQSVRSRIGRAVEEILRPEPKGEMR